MKKSLSQLTERTLTLALGLLFVLPLLLTIIRNLPISAKWSRQLDRAWLGRVELGGVTNPTPEVPLTWRSVRTGKFLERKALQFNESFAGREALIRCTNELWFRLFHDTANASSKIAVGEDDVLFEKNYLYEYFRDRSNKSDLEPWVKKLRRLQDFCRSIDIGFVVMLTPGKASIYPEDTPRVWRRLYDPRPRAAVLIRELFRENGIVFVDGIDLVEREKLKGPPAPLFPKGGSHWNSRAAFIACNAVQARFAEQNKPVQEIEALASTIIYRPKGGENDLVALMNLIYPWTYPCERIEIKPAIRSKKEQLTMAVAGDSFCWSLLPIFNDSAQFSEIGFYFHYSLHKTRFAEGRSATVRSPATPIDFSREVFAADCLLLVFNEASAVSAHNHLSAFIDDALAHRPDPAAPRPAFRGD